MFEVNPVLAKVEELKQRTSVIKGYVDYDAKKERLEEVTAEVEQPDAWNDQERFLKLSKEKNQLTQTVRTIDDLESGAEDVLSFIELAREEEDQSAFDEAVSELEKLEKELAELEFRRMFSGSSDQADCYMDIQSGSGGTEAQDWAEMVLRMYMKWGDRHGFKPQIVEYSEGDVAGIKSATVKFTGEYAYGWLRTETGVHRLVRKSPFDSGNRRHTSFCSAFVYPEVDEHIEININPADLRVDVYRSSGAGGQHINKTESAVRITHPDQYGGDMSE